MQLDNVDNIHKKTRTDALHDKKDKEDYPWKDCVKPLKKAAPQKTLKN